MATEPEHIRVTYNEVHNIIKKSAEQIKEFNPEILIAIGTGNLIFYCTSSLIIQWLQEEG